MLYSQGLETFVWHQLCALTVLAKTLDLLHAYPFLVRNHFVFVASYHHVRYNFTCLNKFIFHSVYWFEASDTQSLTHGGALVNKLFITGMQ